jgi:hypothetical protein
VRSIGTRLDMRLESRKTGQALLRLPPAVRKKVVRSGLREWGKRAAKALRRAVLPADRDMKRDCAAKIRVYKRGKLFWCGVGVRFDGDRVGWRAPMWDGGFRVWAKGPPKEKKHPGRNPNPSFKTSTFKRNWRDGKAKRNLGQKIGKRMFVTRTRQAWQPQASRYVRDAIAEALRSV